MRFQEEFPQEMPLNGIETIFRDFYRKYPERNLELPHPLESFSDILKASAEQSGVPFSNLLMQSSLDEDLFFHRDSDTELYRHLRYLPANWHSHAFFEIVCVVEGCCINYMGEQELSMKKGDVCIIAPETIHALSAFSDDCVVINIILRTSTFEKAFFGVLTNEDVLSDFFSRSLYHSRNRSYLLFRTGGDQEVFDFVLYAYREFHRNHLYRERFLNNIISAFFILLLRNHGSDVSFPEDDKNDCDQNVVFILKYIQEHFTAVTMKELSEFFSYSERQLQRIIKSSTGCSFSANIQRLKMRHAARLLKNPGMSVSAVAEELGYQDAGNFRNVFKKYYGVTPGEYREKSPAFPKFPESQKFSPGPDDNPSRI